jgi:hypothetical protein
MSRTGIVYVAVLLAFGVAIGWYAAAHPGLSSPVLPPFAWPLGVSLVLDLAIMQLAQRGRATALTMAERFGGVFGAGLIVTLMTARAAAA